jgi:hypothetical protein
VTSDTAIPPTGSAPVAGAGSAKPSEGQAFRFWLRLGMISFGRTPAERTSDGVLMLYDGNGFALALKETGESISLPASSIGFGGAESPGKVRALADRLRPTAFPSSRNGRRLRERQVSRSGRLRG